MTNSDYREASKYTGIDSTSLEKESIIVNVSSNNPLTNLKKNNSVRNTINIDQSPTEESKCL